MKFGHRAHELYYRSSFQIQWKPQNGPKLSRPRDGDPSVDFALPAKHLDGDAGYRCVIFQKTNHDFGADDHFVGECNLVKKVAGAWPGLM